MLKYRVPLISLYFFSVFFFFSIKQIPLKQLSMLLFYINCMYKSIKSSYQASFRVEIVFGQNIPLSTCIWPKRPGQKVHGQNVHPPERI